MILTIVYLTGTGGLIAGGIAGAWTMTGTALSYVGGGVAAAANYLTFGYAAPVMTGAWTLGAAGAGVVEGGVALAGGPLYAAATSIGEAIAGSGLATKIGAGVYSLVYFILNIFQLCSTSKMSASEIIENALVSQIFTKITEIRYLETTDLNNYSATEIFKNSIYSDMGGLVSSFASIFTFSNSNRRSAFSKNWIVLTGSVTIYTEDVEEDNEVKSKLVNINIPIQSFYYGLTVVKSTYDKQTGSDLKLYYENKDKFMEEYKKRKK
jgi:hypothetical protein